MRHWTKKLIAAAAPLLLAGCLWGPGRFASDLALRKDGSFVLNYRGEIVLQTPPDANTDAPAVPWSDQMLRCFADGRIESDDGGVVEPGSAEVPGTDKPGQRKCTPAELAKAKAEFDKRSAETARTKREEAEQMAKMFGLPGFDEESSRAFAAKLSKFAGYRSVRYRGKGVYDVDYHFEGRATQDFVFPALPDNDFIIPFIAIRRRSDGSVLVTAPAFTGGSGPFGARAGAAAAGATKQRPVSKAQGRFTIATDGEVLTNNSEDGTSPHAIGRQIRWDVTSSSAKIPEALIRLQ